MKFTELQVAIAMHYRSLPVIEWLWVQLLFYSDNSNFDFNNRRKRHGTVATVLTVPK